ncbi:MAG: hypothetical protein QM763_10720 [Agriterribacter sp.]
MTKKYKNQYLKIGTFSTNPCIKEDNGRVLLPDIKCGVKDKFDVVVTIKKKEKRLQASSINRKQYDLYKKKYTEKAVSQNLTLTF